MANIERTSVVIPYPENEESGCLESVLEFANRNLNQLGIDATIQVYVNGERTKAGITPVIQIPQGKFNADVNVLYAKDIGQSAVIKEAVQLAIEERIPKIFLMDDDIFPFPHAMKHMWDSSTLPVVGANHAVYPPDLVSQAARPLSEEESFFYTMFEAEKHPAIQKIIRKHIPESKTRVRGSLVLVDAAWLNRKMGDRPGIIDSAINTNASEGEIGTAENAYFMHMGRVSFPDHVRAILRHYRAAASRGDLELFSSKQVNFTPQIVEKIADEVRKAFGDTGDKRASFLLLRFAEFQRINDICRQIAGGGKAGTIVSGIPMDPFRNKVHTYASALQAADYLLSTVDWSEIEKHDSRYETTLRELTRVPLDVSPYLHGPLRGIILDSLGVGDDMAELI